MGRLGTRARGESRVSLNNFPFMLNFIFYLCDFGRRRNKPKKQNETAYQQAKYPLLKDNAGFWGYCCSPLLILFSRIIYNQTVQQ